MDTLFKEHFRKPSPHPSPLKKGEGVVIDVKSSGRVAQIEFRHVEF